LQEKSIITVRVKNNLVIFYDLNAMKRNGIVPYYFNFYYAHRGHGLVAAARWVCVLAA
jgi:hypothetical protein